MISEFYKQLIHVKRLQLKTSSEKKSSKNGLAEADVLVTLLENRILFEEVGIWSNPQNEKSFKFTNSFLWEKQADRIRLSHCRLGLDHAVYLFDLIEDGEETLCSAQPHLCGDDVYSGRLALNSSGLTMEMIVQGPMKQDRLLYTYLVG